MSALERRSRARVDEEREAEVEAEERNERDKRDELEGWEELGAGSDAKSAEMESSDRRG